MKKYFHSYVIITISLLLCGCSDKDSEPILTESEISFNEKLASITKDDNEPNNYYIGTEDGIIYRYNSESNHVDTLKTNYDRIYKVYRSKDKITYWIGTRNQGLVRCFLVGDSIFTEQMAYAIPPEYKVRNYSAYDIIEYEEGILAATSHGLFNINNLADSAMNLLYPIIDKSKQDTLRPLVVSKIRALDDSIFCASDSGLLRINKKLGKVEDSISKKPVKSIEVAGQEIRFITDSYLYVLQHERNIKKNPIEHPANTYFYDKNEGINYLIGDRNILLIKDQDIHNPAEYKNIRLKYKVRASTCRNIIADDAVHNQSLMVSEHSIVRIGHHQNVFNTTGKIDFACADGQFVYYLIGSKLYRQDTKTNDTVTAQYLGNLNLKGKGISFMEVHDDTLYYVSADKKQMFKKEVKSNFLLNWFSIEKPLKNMLGKEVTAIGKDNKNVYVGIRDGFQNINHEKTLQLYKYSPIRESCPDPFVTSITDTYSNGDILLGTLNDGIFEGKDNDFHRLEGFNETFIRDIAIKEEGGKRFLYVLTNRKLSVYGAENDSNFVIDAQGYSKLLLGTHAYGIKEYGIHDFDTDTDFFSDIQFNPQASLALNGQIYAGSSNGVYIFKELKNTNGKDCGYKIVEFEPEFEPVSLPTIILSFLLILLLVVVLFLWYRHYRLHKSIPSLVEDSQKLASEKEKKESLERVRNRLRNRLEEQWKFKDLLGEDLLKELENIDSRIDKLGSQEEANVQVEANKLNKDIQTISFRIPIILNLRLEEQVRIIQELKNGEEVAWSKETDEKRKENDLEVKAKTIRDNIVRIEDAKKTEQILCDYAQLFQEIDTIPEVTDESKNILESDRTSKEKVELIEEQLKRMETIEVKEKMKDIISNKVKEIDSLLENMDDKSVFFDIMAINKEEFVQIAKCANDANSVFVKLIKDFSVIDMRYAIIDKILSIRKLIIQRQLALDRKERSKLAIDFQDKINSFYEIVWRSHERALLDLLGIKAKKSEGQFMDANVLALLMADVEITNKEIKEIFSANDQRVRSTRRELIKSIENHREEIVDYTEAYPQSFAVFLLVVADSVINNGVKHDAYL